MMFKSWSYVHSILDVTKESFQKYNKELLWGNFY